jgi:transcriptional regulator
LYTPRSFSFEDAREQAAFIDRFGFATLVTGDGADIQVSHLPLLLDRARGCLIGHMARPNPHAVLLGLDLPCVAIFHGPHAYVSPVWYASDAAVPTWNYSVVHVHGRLRAVEDEAKLIDTLERLVQHFDMEVPAALARSRKAMQGLLRGIVGFEMPIARVDAKHKLSQNKPAADRAGVLAGLQNAKESNGRELAQWMADLGLAEAAA